MRGGSTPTTTTKGGHFQHLAIEDFPAWPIDRRGVSAQTVTAVLNIKTTPGSDLVPPSACAKFVRAISAVTSADLPIPLHAQQLGTTPMVGPDTAKKTTPFPLNTECELVLWAYGSGSSRKRGSAKDLSGGLRITAAERCVGLYTCWIDSSLTSYGMIAREDFIGVLKSDDGGWMLQCAVRELDQECVVERECCTDSNEFEHDAEFQCIAVGPLEGMCSPLSRL
ncbi:hypothetical protein BJ742DRAFT_740003 [Cladochytrium replicatum]|nr:hypothetical protein BJ742DRAFT_740003 [Cladochytrium replicatum]